MTRIVLRASSLLLALTVALIGCAADPPPPIQSTQTPEATAEVASTAGNPVVVAIDDVGTGFNPHLQSNQSTANVAVSTMLLPSPFVPSVGPDGSTVWILDSRLMVSAEVTNLSPFTVEYVIRDVSQWSDSAPIAAEDFSYLWQQMISSSGVVDPAGYSLIDNIASTNGGKTVIVTMAQPYPAWRELFTNLLPSHLVKDSPGGFEDGLNDGVPVSGGPFRIKSIDEGRDEILLERNDRFWDQPAVPDQILLRRGGSASQLAGSMRSGDTQIAQVRGGAAARAQLSAIPNIVTTTKFQPRSLRLVLNGRVPALADVNVRRGVFGLLDADLLSTVAAGSGTSDRAARAQILSPSDPGYKSTAPTPIGTQNAARLLTDAGYSLVPLEPTSAAPTSSTPSTTDQIAPTPAQLTMVLGAPEDDDVAIAVANTAADQLRVGGVDATVSVLPSTDLYGDALTSGAIDAVIGWARTGGDPGTVLASRFACAPDSSAPGAPAPVSTTTTTTTADPAAARPNPLTLSNVSGLCDPSLQATIDSALVGGSDAAAVVAAAEPALWALSAVLPIIQDTSIAATAPEVTGATLSGPPELGVFADAPQWKRVNG